MEDNATRASSRAFTALTNELKNLSSAIAASTSNERIKKAVKLLEIPGTTETFQDAKTSEIREESELVSDLEMEENEMDQDSRIEEQKLKPREKRLQEELKFMNNFDPASSIRNQSKRRKKYFHPDGTLMRYAEDLGKCDCLDSDCPGCHYPCRICGSTLCASECQKGRLWLYEHI